MANVIKLASMPESVRNLPRDDRGFPIPWHLGVGAFRHRTVAAGKLEQAIAQSLCWICGRQLARRTRTFVMGPMAAIARRATDPACHRACAVYAAMTDRSFTGPHSAACVWVTNSYRIMPIDNRMMFCLGDPLEVSWYCQGKPATRREVARAIERSLPVMIDEANKESDVALQVLLQALQRMRRYLPETKGVGDAQGATLRDDSQRERPRATGTHR